MDVIASKDTETDRAKERTACGIRETPNCLMELSVDLYTYVLCVYSGPIHIFLLSFLQIHSCRSITYHFTWCLQVHGEIFHGELFYSTKERNISSDVFFQLLRLFRKSNWQHLLLLPVFCGP